MKLPQKNEIYALEKDAQEKYGVPALELMENAGEAVFRFIRGHIRKYRSKKYLVFCGPGNNGGDGLVVARKLVLDSGKPGSVRVLMVRGAPGQGEAAVNFSLAAESGVRIGCLPRSGTALDASLKSCDVVIDAIYGIGYRPSGGAEGRAFALLADRINASGKTVIAVDIPSGVLADGGEFPSAVRADATVAFGFPKIGLLDGPGREYAGRRTVAPIGLPEKILRAPKVRTNLLTPEDARSLYKPRKRQSHKGHYGHLLVIGGSAGDARTGEPSMSGAVILAGLAALRCGAGLLTVAAPEAVLAAVRKNLPESMALPLDQNPKRAAVNLKKYVRKRRINCVLVGNGLGTGDWQKKILSAVLADASVRRLVVDADALNILAEDSPLSRTLSAPGRVAILTPHIGEMARLSGRDRGALKSGKLKAASAFAKSRRVYVILKDAVSALAFPDGESWLNETGTPALAKGGSGDVLAGITAGLLTSGYDAKSACLLGAFCLGRAGERAEKKRSAESVIARDVIAELPAVFRELGKTR